jgi:hypothetical protein
MNTRILAVIGASVFGTLVLILTLLYVLRPEARRASELPREVIDQATGLTIYYPDPLPGSFKLETGSVQYSRGILSYRLADSKHQMVTITVQSVPSDLSNSTIQGKESVPTSYGTATISQVEGRTSGYLITKDKRTLIILNANDQIDSAAFKDVVRALKPMKQ